MQWGAYAIFKLGLTNMRNCFDNYGVEIDSIEKGRWEELLLEFNDASIHQTWSMGAVCFGERNLSHHVLRRGGEIIAMAEIRIRKLPIFKAGVATVFWGPLWRRKGKSADYTVLDKMIEALRNEYVFRRRLLLRIWPIGFENSEEGNISRSILQKYGFIRSHKVQPYRTLLLDLSPSLEELRKNLAQKWRNQLNVAERSNLSLMEGTSDEMYITFLRMLREMVSRKKFEGGVDYNLYGRIQSCLPDYLKMKIFICNCEGEPVSAGVFSAIGHTAEYLLGATANNGLKVNGSNLIHWGVMKWLKERACLWYDLGGIDPCGNPGVYHFKRGLVGKSGREVTHLGQFFLADNPISYFLNVCIDRINAVRAKLSRSLSAYSRN